MAVGGYADSNGVGVTLAERWDGNTWTVQSTPNPSGSQYFSFLAGVSCTSSTACIAVGGSDAGALAERWNGTKWSIQSTPSPGQFPQLNSVMCTSASACIAVGSYVDSSGNGVALAERWNGTKWSVQSIPSPTGSQNSFLNGISCLSSSACTANGGSDGSTLAEQWNGHGWSIQASPTPAGNGGAQFNGLSCPTATTCVGVGTGSNASGAVITFGEGWDGSQWSLQATVNPPGDGGAKLQGVSCKSASACIAVGGSVSSSNISVGTFAEQWNGMAWSIQSTPNPAGAAGSTLYGVSCTSPSVCIAVGGTVDGSNNNNPVGTLAEQWNGTAWAIQPTPAAAGLGSSLNAVSCSSPNSCTAVGNTTTGPLAEHWDGTSWTIQPTPAPASVDNSGFGGVSCTSASSCIAVGITFASGNLAGTFAEQWNGTAWSMLPTPTATTVGYGMDAVSCTSASACIGVGQTDTGLLAERWDGTTWTEQSVVTPAGTEGNGDTFTGVSCSSPSACTATGVVYPSQQTITERWDGTSWTVQDTPALPGAYDNDLPAMSCPTSSVCMSVGGYANDGAHATLAEQWNGGGGGSGSNSAVGKARHTPKPRLGACAFTPGRIGQATLNRPTLSAWHRQESLLRYQMGGCPRVP